MSDDELTITVDRGQPVIVTAHFGDGDPDVVYFSYLQPGGGKPFVDDGYGQSRSRITRLGIGEYRYVISTLGFTSGDGEWSFTGEWDAPLPEGHDSVAIRGKYVVRKSSTQLP